MTEAINPGDVVQLKSGGPRMTAYQVGKDSFGDMTVWCEWFDDKKAPQKGTFNLASVKKASPRTGAVGVRSTGMF